MIEEKWNNVQLKNMLMTETEELAIKKGDRLEAENYKPVLLIAVTCK